MGIQCPGCGRTYDPSRFSGGRTLHCACGTRVGAEPGPGPDPAAREPRFIADAMLGRLARWLRLLGFDTSYAAGIEDAELVRVALQEHRIILSRDRRIGLEWRVPGLYLVAAERPLDQLREVAERFGLAGRARPLTRCARCNGALVPASPGEARGAVPANALAAALELMRCERCGRFYWSGSHVRRVRRIIAETLPGAGA